MTTKPGRGQVPRKEISDRWHWRGMEKSLMMKDGFPPSKTFTNGALGVFNPPLSPGTNANT
jgi:hypothetical protein